MPFDSVAQVWALFGLLWAVYGLNHVGRGGRERLSQMADDRLRSVYDLYRDWGRPAPAVVAALIGSVLMVVSLARAETGSAVLWASCAAFQGLAALVLRHARPNVLAVVADRDLPPAWRETSARRARRQRRLGAATAIGFFGGALLLGLWDRLDGPAWLAVVGGLGMIVSIGTAVMLLWSAVWIYGDEKREEVP